MASTFYTDIVLDTKPTTFHRMREVPANSGVINDVMGRANLAFPNPTSLTQGTIAIPVYGSPSPAAVNFPLAQGAQYRINSGVNAVFDRGSATTDFTMACWATRVADSSSGFPAILGLGSSINNCVCVYMNESLSRVDSVYRTDAGGAAADTGTGTGTGFTFTTGAPHLIALRWTGSTGMLINIDGVDRGTRTNPTTKWANITATAVLTPGTRGNSSSWEGQVGDVMFWQRDVSAAELLAIYQAGTATPPGGAGTGTSASKIWNGSAWVGI